MMKKWNMTLMSGLLALLLLLSSCSLFPADKTEVSTLDEAATTESQEASAPIEAETTAELSAESSTAAESSAAEEKPVQNLELSSAPELIASLISSLEAGDGQTAALMAEDLKSSWQPIAQLRALPTMQEILKDRAWIEFKVQEDIGKDPQYKAGELITFQMAKEGDYWQIVKFGPTTELYPDEGKMVIESKVDKPQKFLVKFRQLSQFPLCTPGMENAGEIMKIANENKEIFFLKRWEEGANREYLIKLIAFNGVTMPAEIVYKENGEVYSNREFSEDYGLFLYAEGQKDLMERLIALVK